MKRLVTSGWWLGAIVCLTMSTSSAAEWPGGIPLAEPASQRYGFAEALIMGRDNQGFARPLVSEVGNPDTVFIAEQDLQFPFGGGLRAFLGNRTIDRGGWELGYFGLYGQSASASASTSGTTFLEAAPPLGYTLTDSAQQATVTWNSVINSAECNLFRSSTERGETALRTIDWLVGFRYVGVEESARMVLTSCCGAGPLVPYGVRTRSSMFGGQIGGRGRLDWNRWALEGWAKAALMGSSREQMQDPLVDWLGTPVPGRATASSATDSVVGFVGDINVSAVYRLNDVWGIRAGYNTIWITGAALAPDQFSFSAFGAPTSVAGTGGIFLHGANLGLEARW